MKYTTEAWESEHGCMGKGVTLVGPVYIAHPYAAQTPERRELNVRRAAELSSAVNWAGCCTISPLQEGRGRESALSEEQWVQHGLALLRVCKAVVVPELWGASRGCAGEVNRARFVGIPVFEATYGVPSFSGSDETLESVWELPPSFYEWIKRERKAALA